MLLLPEHALELLAIPLALIARLVGALLIDGLVDRFLPKKRSLWYRIPLIYVFMVTINLPSWLGDENTFLVFPFFIAGFLLCYTGRWYARLTVGVIFFVFVLTTNILTETLFEQIHMAEAEWLVVILVRILLWGIFLVLARRQIPKDPRRITAPAVGRIIGGLLLTVLTDVSFWQVYQIDSERFSICLARTLLWGVFYLLARRFFPKEIRLIESPRLWGLLIGLSLTALASVLGFVVWDSFMDFAEADWALLDMIFYSVVVRLGVAILPFTALSAMALLAAIVVLSRHEELQERQKLAEIQAVYYQGLQTEQAEVRRIRHDMHNHIAAARGFLARDDAAAAEHYLESLADTNALTGTRQICENPVANAVLASKADVMEDEGLTANWSVSLPASLPVSDVDLCSLLGNALDNAIEAARTAEDKRVLVRARSDKGVLMLRVENAVGVSPHIERGRFKTTKADPVSHGIGLDSMSEIARRYGGTLDAKAENGRFELVVVMPMGKIEGDE